MGLGFRCRYRIRRPESLRRALLAALASVTVLCAGPLREKERNKETCIETNSLSKQGCTHTGAPVKE